MSLAANPVDVADTGPTFLLENGAVVTSEGLILTVRGKVCLYRIINS